jgi:hypothetical protein
VIRLCDSLRSGDKFSKPRTLHHLDAIAVTQQLLPDEESEDEASDEEVEFDVHVDPNLPDSGYSTMDSIGTGGVQDLVDIFAREADEILNQPHSFTNTLSPTPPAPQQSKTSTPVIPSATQQPRSMSSNSLQTNPISFSQPNFCNRRSTKPSTTVTSASTPRSVTPPQANKYRCHCGYEPSGSEEWKASNFARHKRTLHAPAAKVYKCGFLGCTAKYGRSDNLRAHLRLKGHGDEDLLLGDFGEGILDQDQDDLRARPSKRRKRGDSGEVELQ